VSTFRITTSSRAMFLTFCKQTRIKSLKITRIQIIFPWPSPGKGKRRKVTLDKGNNLNARCIFVAHLIPTTLELACSPPNPRIEAHFTKAM
jgi:hypothetical protein